MRRMAAEANQAKTGTRSSVAVLHPEMMVAEGLGNALLAHPTIGRVVVGDRIPSDARALTGIDAVAVAVQLPGAIMAVHRLRRAGVHALLLGESTDDQDGLYVSTSGSLDELASVLAPGTAMKTRVETLTHRERQVLALVADGLGAKHIAGTLELSHKTVESYKNRIYSKLGVSTQAAAVAVYCRETPSTSTKLNL